jgi:cell division septation protein DedD
MKEKRKSPSTAERPPLTFSRKSVWGWVCLMFLICGWMFFIGVLVGRGTAPLKFDIPQIRDRLKSSLGSLEEDHKTSAPKDGGVVKDNTELDFYEDLKKNKADGDSLKLRDPKAVPQKIDTGPERPVTEKQVQSEAQPAAVESSPPPVRQPEEKPEPQKASEDKSKSLTVQVASVRNAQDADRLVEKLQKGGYPAYRAIGKVPGQGIWYRVRVGQYATRSEAQKILEQLKKEGQKPIMVNLSR